MRIKTFARVRHVPYGEICVSVENRSGMVQVLTDTHTHNFAFDGVFDWNDTQETVFEQAVVPVAKAALEGYNGTVFAYGQTGSGKTYSITGGEQYETRGVIPRAVSMLFEDPNLVCCKISYVEVFNELVFDLLDNRARVDVYANDNGGKNTTVHLKNLTVHSVKTEEEALDLLFRGCMQRSTGSTALNMSSSRSHCLFSIEIQTGHTTSRLNFVDLAGSERTQDHTSKNINLSLHFLEQVVVNLQNQQQHVGFRNSTMTALLRESLGGNCQTIFLVTMNPSVRYLTETLSTCRFAQRCRSLSTNVMVNESLDQKVLRLERENTKLKEDLGVALTALKEHDEVRDMLHKLLDSMDHDMAKIASTEISFLNDIDIHVAVESNEIIAKKRSSGKTMKINRDIIVALERCKPSQELCVFKLCGRFGATNLESVLELEYKTDGSMVQQTTWLQALEHWLGEHIEDNTKEVDEESKEATEKKTRPRGASTQKMVQRAFTAIRKIKNPLIQKS